MAVGVEVLFGLLCKKDWYRNSPYSAPFWCTRTLLLTFLEIIKIN
tara:strand:+ start:2673 stop:2807 length:135 start_codon:yes stop_codon:yes gene_type:complete